MVECFAHPEGLLYFDPFWEQQAEAAAVHLLRGTLKGEGPWKVGDAVITVLGCHHTDPEVADAYAAWQTHLQMAEYPSRPEIAAIARRHGAAI